MLRSPPFVLLILPLLFASVGARAQTLDDAAGQGPGSLDAERLRPGLDRESIADVESGNVGEDLDLDVALQLGYAQDPIAGTMTTNAGRSRFVVVSQRLGANLTAAIGLFGRFKLGADVPVVVFQNGPAALPGIQGKNPVAVAGLGDVRLVPKLALLRVRDGSPIDLAVLAHVTLPTSVPRHAYIGDGLPTLTPEFAASRDYGQIRWAANVGAKLRVPSTFGDAVQGEELTYRAGVGYDFDALPVGVDMTVNGAALLFPEPLSAGNNPLEGLVGMHVDVGDVQIYGAGGAGIINGIGAPLYRVLAGARWSPRCRDDDHDGICGEADACGDAAEDVDHHQDHDGCPDPDNDNDGIVDGADQCPGEAGPAPGCPVEDQDADGVPDAADQCLTDPEDRDGDHDDDGCPEVEAPIVAAPIVAAPRDTDGDGFLDEVDRCPTDAEDMDGNADTDGCPEQELARLSLGSAVAFAVGSSSLQPEGATAILKLIAGAKASGRPFTVKVEGHTDDRGSAAQNQTLSQARADAVKRLLIEQGVAAETIDAQGFGPTRPVAPNTTSKGRQENRRVELIIEG